MTTMHRCPSCAGFVPARLSDCPNCGATEPAPVPGSVRVPFWLRAAGGSAIAMTMMACYGDTGDYPYWESESEGPTTYGQSTGTTSGTTYGTTEDPITTTTTGCDTECASSSDSGTAGSDTGTSGSDTGASGSTAVLDSSGDDASSGETGADTGTSDEAG